MLSNLLVTLNQTSVEADLRRELSKTVLVLKALKSGEITLANLSFTDDGGWRLEETAAAEPVQPVEAEPAT